MVGVSLGFVWEKHVGVVDTEHAGIDLLVSVEKEHGRGGSCEKTVLVVYQNGEVNAKLSHKFGLILCCCPLDLEILGEVICLWRVPV